MNNLLDPHDVAPLDAPKALAAAERFRLEVVTSASSDAFAAGYQMLDGFFGPLGELEPASVLAEFVESGFIDYGAGMEGHYRFIVAWDGDALAGVRDCYVDIDVPGRRSIVALSHSYVAPEHRRSGLAALFRTLPASLGRRVLAEHKRVGGAIPMMLSAEMEPPRAGSVDAIVRLLSYGRSGYKVIDPSRLPYSQPDFRDLDVLGLKHTGIPFIPVVRVIDHPDAATIPIELASAFPEFFHVCHRRYLDRSRVDPSEEHALSTLRRGSRDVELLPLPTSADSLDSLRPLLAAELVPRYPLGLRGPADRAPERAPDDEWRALLEGWRR